MYSENTSIWRDDYSKSVEELTMSLNQNGFYDLRGWTKVPLDNNLIAYESNSQPSSFDIFSNPPPTGDNPLSLTKLENLFLIKNRFFKNDWITF